jgi:hypothetical protein
MSVGLVIGLWLSKAWILQSEHWCIWCIIEWLGMKMVMVVTGDS